MICTGLLQGICLGLLFLLHILAQMEATFSRWFLGPYKVSKIGYGLQPAERTSTSFMGAILEEYLVIGGKQKDCVMLLFPKQIIDF